MTLIEELLQLLEGVYEDGYHSAYVDYASTSGVALTQQEAAQQALEKLRKEISSHTSMCDERQLDDPRLSYVDVQIEKEFYRWLFAEN